MTAAMSWDVRPEVARLVRALLHEGYLLYPYRPSAVKNRFRWTVGALLPRPPLGEVATEPSGLAVDLLVVAPEGTQVATRLAFLHVLERPPSGPAPAEPHQEATERALDLAPFALGGPPAVEVLDVAADPGQEPLRLEVRRAASRVGSAAGGRSWRLSLEVENVAPAWPLATPRTTAILRAPVAVHALVRAEPGPSSASGLASLREPPPGLEAEARACRCRGAWPVLLGAPPLAEEALVSPVILDEPPALAPESPGDLFDSAEMDAMLVLRLLTLGEDEAREAAAADPRARALLERARRLGPDERAPLHGAVRRLTSVGPGDRVRLRPRRRADVLDGALAGRAATVVAVEHDVEGRSHVAVVVDDDPGRDLGVKGDIPGHRFFFGADEVEPLGGAP